ncbi:hypothetical protein BCR44DRAFT_1427226 [Catenaria anguillulae PL171]|uniref:Uncharacterized protein n=1 Tax=Catenaria anguillulae PL171 TaxID=765915 RepID=A0A1Y2HZF7_9FUNG|nr:hypothetical protein BCR44DRAFT_1448122 [Catenaria anguillulae PL171]ORZ39113.1 hypothetical protein BCR44DRAFT_1427226 [Catenaria anguillulae PL171]
MIRGYQAKPNRSSLPVVVARRRIRIRVASVVVIFVYFQRCASFRRLSFSSTFFARHSSFAAIRRRRSLRFDASYRPKTCKRTHVHFSDISSIVHA